MFVRTRHAPLRHRVSRAALAASLALTGVLTACSDEPTLPAGAPTLEESVGFTQAKWHKLIESADRAIERCMAREGFTYDAHTIDWKERLGAPHGLFEIITPTSELEYLKTQGYGMSNRIRGLLRASRENADDKDVAYYNSLTPADRLRFTATLTGATGSPTNCQEAVPDVISELRLPSDGPLAGAFGQAIGELHESDEYEDFAEAVITCIRDRGVEVAEDDDLVSVQRPLLVRSLELTHSDFSYDDDGRIHFSMKATDITPEVLQELPAFRAEELRVARVEAACREENAKLAHELMVRFTGPLVQEYADDVSLLKRAMNSSS